ncbi:hypothetical protein IP84_09745 [beta proteobacterium AAP99]|nr:hypothetical protein IP84_09745 [beta proteobacterium AAP99]
MKWACAGQCVHFMSLSRPKWLKTRMQQAESTSCDALDLAKAATQAQASPGALHYRYAFHAGVSVAV